MNVFPSFLSLTAAVMVCTGCAGDPVAELLKRNGGFAVVRPPSDGEYLGDVYRTKGLMEQSISMKDVMEPDALNKVMTAYLKRVDIESISGKKDFKLSLEAAYIGVAKGDLEISGAHKYRVTVSNPVIHDSPFDAQLVPILIPAIKSKFPNVPLEGKYIVRSLLEVDGMEYEFFSENGGKINISADQNLVRNLTAKLGTEWKVTRDGKLTITRPRYIGYRLARIDKVGGAVAAAPSVAAAAVAGQPASEGTKLSSVPISEYENRDLRERKKKRR
jgi:hypothetical protein